MSDRLGELKTVHVSASVDYDVVIGAGLLDELDTFVRPFCAWKKVVLVSDDEVFPRYGSAAAAAFEGAGAEVFTFVFKSGEESKSFATYEELTEFMCRCRLSRSDIAAALGGGVTGDLTGFAAVDSSVGGKTAINLRAGKNQLGCFHQPAAVICDTDAFSTLPEREVRSGSAEIIKYGVIGDEGFFESLGEEPISARYEAVVECCVSMKRDFVARDEFDRGERRYLNFGHTIGHAAERCSGYTLPHGYAVAMGMAAISRAAESFGISEKGTAERIEKMLKRYGLPTEINFARDDMLDAMLSDKKSDGSSVALIVPERIGRCRIENAGAAELCEWLKAGGIK